MNRCSSQNQITFSVLRTTLLTILLGTCLAANALDSVRPFPPTALRGTLQVIQHPEVLLDGRPARLSPGARIRGVNNLIVMSGSLVGQPVLVNYVRDDQGMLHDVWVLNQTEARLPMRRVQPQNANSSTFGTPAADAETAPR